MGIVRWNEDEKKAVEEIREVWEIRDLDSEKIVTKRGRAMYRRFAYREMQKRKDKRQEEIFMSDEMLSYRERKENRIE